MSCPIDRAASTSHWPVTDKPEIVMAGGAWRVSGKHSMTGVESPYETSHEDGGVYKVRGIDPDRYQSRPGESISC